MSEWIKCSEQLPSKDSLYEDPMPYFLGFGHRIYGSRITRDTWSIFKVHPSGGRPKRWTDEYGNYYYITHWMPLPELPSH